MTLQEARAKHGRVRIFACDIEDDDGVISKVDVIARKPTRAEVMRFGSGLMGTGGESKVEALEGIVHCCVVSPPVEALLEENYGLVFALGNEIASWAGVGKGVESKKA